jgi:hypothetical protein
MLNSGLLAVPANAGRCGVTEPLIVHRLCRNGGYPGDIVAASAS